MTSRPSNNMDGIFRPSPLCSCNVNTLYDLVVQLHHIQNAVNSIYIPIEIDGGSRRIASVYLTPDMKVEMTTEEI